MGHAHWDRMLYFVHASVRKTLGHDVSWKGDSPNGIDARRGNGLDDGIDHSITCGVVAMDVEDALANVISRVRAAAAARVRDAHALNTAGCGCVDMWRDCLVNVGQIPM